VHDFDYVTPRGAREASLVMKNHAGAAALKAGGIDLVDLMKEGIAAPTVIVNLLPLRDLASIRDDEARGLTVGALATLATIAAHPAVLERYPLLAAALGEAATPQLRNTATIGGNLCQRPRCWYFRSADFACLKKGGDTCFAVEGDNRYHAIFGDDSCHIVSPTSAGLALVALGGTISALSPTGEREIEAASFFAMPSADVTKETTLGAHEVITGVRVPAPAKGAVSAHIKVREQEASDWAIAEVAVALVKEGGGAVRSARIVLGAVAPVPWRASEAEKALAGKPVTEQTAATAADAALAGAKPMSGNAWKVGLTRELVRRAILQAR
jgi:xanthine dehydrogenase YagS FAD-binding subunit